MREVNAHGAALLTLEGAMRADAAADCRTDLSVLQPEPEPQTPSPSPKPQAPSPKPQAQASAQA